MNISTEVTFDRIIAFVVQAMSQDFKVTAWAHNIYIENKETKEIVKIHFYYIPDNCLVVTTPLGDFELKTTEKEQNKLKVLEDQVKEYEEEKSKLFFNNFFKEDKKPTSINDLDNDEE